MLILARLKAAYECGCGGGSRMNFYYIMFNAFFPPFPSVCVFASSQTRQFEFERQQRGSKHTVINRVWLHVINISPALFSDVFICLPIDAATGSSYISFLHYFHMSAAVLLARMLPKAPAIVRDADVWRKSERWCWRWWAAGSSQPPLSRCVALHCPLLKPHSSIDSHCVYVLSALSWLSTTSWFRTGWLTWRFSQLTWAWAMLREENNERIFFVLLFFRVQVCVPSFISSRGEWGRHMPDSLWGSF